MIAQSFLFLLSLWLVSVYGYLTINQWKVIRSIITQQDISNTIREKVQMCIFKHYNKWAVSKAYDFKKLHKHKCRHIKIEELSVYASCGLWQAIKNYNRSYPFPHFANYYISGELYNGLTKLYPISSIPKKIRIQKKTKGSVSPSSAIYVGKDAWLLEKNQVEDNTNHENIYQEYKDIWNKINEINDPFTKKVLHYKYNFYFDKIRTNKEISLLMCCSSEKVRRKVLNGMEQILSP